MENGATWFIFMYACVSVQRPEEGIGSAGAGVTGAVSCWMWALELNSGPPRAGELFYRAEPSLHLLQDAF